MYNEKMFKNKYLKYKFKYLQLKNQKGGNRDDDFPKSFLDEMITRSCMKSHDIKIDSGTYNKMKEFFTIIKNTYTSMYLPPAINFNEQFIGRTTFDKKNIEKIYSKLDKKPVNGATEVMKKLYYIKINPENKTEYIEINDFINITDNLITIGENKIQFSKTKDNILCDLITNESIKFRNNDDNNDAVQVSGENSIIGWVSFAGSADLFHESAINAGFQFINNVYKKDNIFLLYKKGASDDIKYCMLYIKEANNIYSLFPYSYNNFILNDTFKEKSINLFNIIKDKINEIFNNSNNDLLYNYLNKKYNIDKHISQFNLKINLEGNKILLEKAGFINRITILVYINAAISEIPEEFDPPDYINELIENLSLTDNLEDNLNLINNVLNRSDIKTLENDTLEMFEKIQSSDLFIEFKKSLLYHYNILPDSFFHLHITNASNKYILLTIHADREIQTRCDNITYTFVDKEKKAHTITRYKQPSHNASNNEINNLIKNHAFYLLFNLTDNKHKLYSFNNLDGKCFKSILFAGEHGTLGVNETVFGDVIGDINYINSFDVIYSPGKRPCKYLCTNTDTVYNVKTHNACSGHITCTENIITNDENGYNSTDGNEPYPMKCSSFRIIEGSTHYVFIDDILVSRDFMDCNIKKIKPTGILDNIKNFAKRNKLDNIQLEDAAFLQIPDKYFSASFGNFKQSLLYLQFSPEKHSIYSSKFNFKNIHSDTKWYQNLLIEFTRIRDMYTTTNTYSLIEEATKLLKLQKPIDNLPVFKEFEKQYKQFNTFVVEELQKYIGKEKKLGNIEDQPHFNSFPDFLALYNLDKYILHIK